MKAKVLGTTIAKQSSAQAKDMAPQFKTELKPGSYNILKWVSASSGHFKVTFSQPMA